MDQRPSNIPSELHKAPARELKVQPQDPETVAAVNEFIQQKAAETSGVPRPINSSPAPEDPNQPPIEQRPIEVPPNTEFARINPQDVSVSNALAIDHELKLTDMERETFLKAVLNDEPVRLSVSLYNKQFQVELRSRTTFEQRRVFDVLDMDREEGVIAADNVALMVTRMQHYLAVLMVERINNVLFSELKLDAAKDLATHAKQLRDKVAEKAEAMIGVRWNSILTALQVFENKCAKMNTEALNEDFWKPQGSA